ncbi:B30 [miniopterid betaherpesvirus 1]|uniref:B30 n=1 Tax=miniopterid betaherpesvirus 1 TaxID=3070189 RepID=I3VQ05_9BETA|nr:B30 [miniopterid betaherpesvirus 1]AFK83849.1 B30 [miniopterid betaherpesvirus 1]
MDAMVSSTVMLTCDGAFGIRGLSFENDSVVWATLINGYLEIEDELCGPVMKAEAFLDHIRNASFFSDADQETVSLAKIFCIGHYVKAYYAQYRGKRNTLIGYIRDLCKMANSMFCRLIVLRYMGERRNNANMRAVFDVLKNPIDDETYGAVAYSNDALYESYRVNLNYVSKILCNCAECQDNIVSRPLGRVLCVGNPRPRMADRGRGRSWLGDKTVHLKGSASFPPMCLPDIGHLSDAQISVILEELSNDVMQRHVYSVMDAGQLPLRLDTTSMGRDFMERNTIMLIYNVTFTLFLLSSVRKLIRLELDLLKCAFVEEVSNLRGCVANNPISEYYLDSLCNGRFSSETLPGLTVNFLAYFKVVRGCRSSMDSNRAKVVMEHLSLTNPRCHLHGERELMLARTIRSQILSECRSVNFDEIRREVDLLTVTDSALYTVAGIFMFKAPFGFGECGRSNMISDMVNVYAKRRRALISVQAMAEAKRARKRVPRDAVVRGVKSDTFQ